MKFFNSKSKAIGSEGYDQMFNSDQVCCDNGARRTLFSAKKEVFPGNIKGESGMFTPEDCCDADGDGIPD